MSRTRHTFLYDEESRRMAQMAGGAWEFEHGHVIRSHSHVEDQVLFASEGVMSVETDEGIWVVPPLRAAWIPAKTRHSVRMSGRVSMRTLYLSPRSCSALPRRCLVINVSALLKELILHACQFARLRRRVAVERRVIEVILDQLKTVESIAIPLPYPRDPRARKLAEMMQSNPSDPRHLRVLAAACGTSTRTMQRLFAQETNLSFVRWRQRARLLHGMRSLAAGEPVTQAALEAGYSTPSAFISMFRKQLGTTPTRYLAARG